MSDKKIDGIITMEVLDGEVDFDLNADPLYEDGISDFISCEIDGNKEDYLEYENKKIAIIFSVNSVEEDTYYGTEYDSEMEIHNIFVIYDDLAKYYKMKNKYESEEIENLFKNGIPEVEEIF